MAGAARHRINLSSWAPADIIVIFNPLPPKLASRPIRDRVATPSVNDDYRSARLEPDRRIDTLLDEIAQAPKKQ